MIVVVAVVVMKADEVEGDGDEGVDGKCYNEVHVESNEVKGKTKLNKFN